MIDSHLNWKSQVNYNHLKEIIKRNIGILSKLRHYVNLKTLTNLYYSLIQLYIHFWYMELNYCLGEYVQINFNPNYQFTKKSSSNHYFF